MARSKPKKARKAARPSEAAAPAKKMSRKARPVRRGRTARKPTRTAEMAAPERAGAPSTLSFDKKSSAARSGRAALKERLESHHETNPAMTAGDVDADWEQAYSSGDEAPGGDNPTPDQDVVAEIGKALGVEYQDGEELKASDKIAQRDRRRWELDPASSEDYRDRGPTKTKKV